MLSFRAIRTNRSVQRFLQVAENLDQENGNRLSTTAFAKGGDNKMLSGLPSCRYCGMVLRGSIELGEGVCNLCSQVEKDPELRSRSKIIGTLNGDSASNDSQGQAEKWMQGLQNPNQLESVLNVMSSAIGAERSSEDTKDLADLRQQLCNLGAIPVLIDIVRRTSLDEDVRKNAAVCLLKHGRDENSDDLIRFSGGIEALVRFTLDAVSADSRTAGTRALMNLSWNNAKNREAIIQAGGRSLLTFGFPNS